MTQHRRLAAFASIVALSQASCSAIGPASISANRTDYNMAIQHTNDQELLLNLVRSHYRDTMYFTTVERIAATEMMVRSAEASASFGFLQNSPEGGISPLHNSAQGLTLGPAAVSITENPTVFYAPIEGEKFVRQMMTPMNPEVLLLLVRSGWSIDRVLSISVEDMNGLQNAPTASGPTPSYEPEFKDFREAVHLMRELQREHKLKFGRTADGKRVEIRLAHQASMSPSGARLKRLLNLAPNIDKFAVVADPDKQDENTLVLTTRSLVASINYLSQGIDVPKRDIASRWVRTTVHTDGKTPFDWQELLDGVFHVLSADAPPAASSVAIKYRNTWFYIPNDDIDSKSTFVLLTQLIALHSVPPAAGGPALSIAVGH
jgi:hypothetical protein